MRPLALSTSSDRQPPLRMAALVCACLLVTLFQSRIRGAVIPAGTALEARLSTPAGSRVSRPGDRISATIIAPLLAKDRQVLLNGANISGEVDDVQPLGFGLKHGIARIDFRFDSMTLSDGRRFSILTRVREVENAREHVDEMGNVDGILPTANLSAGLSFAISTLLFHTELTAPAAIVKVIAARSPDSEIYLPVGTELVVELERPLSMDLSRFVRETAPPLSEDDRERVQKFLTTVPIQQTTLGGKCSSDLVNILLLGTPEQVDAAFRRAGWTGENRRGVMALYRMYHGLVQRTGYSMAPMAPLTLNGVRATRTYQKSLDTIAKRHHVRLWNQPASDTWLAAASEDIGFTVRDMHVTHAIDLAIDNERAKVVNDLWFTGCVQAASLLPRQSLRVIAHRGSPLATDGEIAVLRLNNCEAPLTDGPRDTGRTRAAEAFEAAGMDIARANPLTVGLLSFRSIAEHRRRSHGSAARLNAESWRRPNVIEPPPSLNRQQQDRPLQVYDPGQRHGGGADFLGNRALQGHVGEYPPEEPNRRSGKVVGKQELKRFVTLSPPALCHFPDRPSFGSYPEMTSLRRWNAWSQAHFLTASRVIVKSLMSRSTSKALTGSVTR
jgi:LssY C-terminus